ncbi:MAG: hypothetical protein HRU31_18785 [Rhodobacteraceae bacterium]|nr:hypothetical protein [Paracoccaceae bacterium]
MSSNSGYELWCTGVDWPLVILNGKIRDNITDDAMKDMGILITIPKADFDRLFKAWASDDSPDPITLEDKYLPAPSMTDVTYAGFSPEGLARDRLDASYDLDVGFVPQEIFRGPMDIPVNTGDSAVYTSHILIIGGQGADQLWCQCNDGGPNQTVNLNGVI